MVIVTTLKSFRITDLKNISNHPLTFRKVRKIPRNSSLNKHHDSMIMVHKQPSRGVLKKRCSENMQQIYRRTPMPKYDFNKVAKQKSPFFLSHLSFTWIAASEGVRNALLKNTCEWHLRPEEILSINSKLN